MGVDRRGPVEVPASTELRWKRICGKCAKVEHTIKTTEEIIKTPKF